MKWMGHHLALMSRPLEPPHVVSRWDVEDSSEQPPVVVDSVILVIHLVSLNTFVVTVTSALHGTWDIQES